MSTGWRLLGTLRVGYTWPCSLGLLFLLERTEDVCWVLRARAFTRSRGKGDWGLRRDPVGPTGARRGSGRALGRVSKGPEYSSRH